MARTVSFSPYQGDTIKALQARQQDLAKVQPLIPTRSIVNPVQGFASVVDQLANEINMARAKRDEHAATQGMAQLMSSFGDQGPSQEQIGAMAAFDPEVAVDLLKTRQQTLAEQARLKAQQEFQTGERVAGEQFQAGQTQAGYTHEGQVDTRELEQQKAAEARAAATKATETQATYAHEGEVDTRELEQQKAKEARDLQAKLDEEARSAQTKAAEPQSAAAKAYADYNAGRFGTVGTPEAMKARDDAARAGRPEVTAQDRKALYDQQDAYVESQSAIGNLKEASTLLKQGVNWGMTAGLQTTYGAAGGPGGDEARAQRTKRYNQIMNASAIAAMSQQLKGATSNQEMTEFIKNLNDPTIDPTIKGQMVDRMLAKAATYQELQRGRIKELGGDPPELQQPPAAGDEAALLKGAQDAIDRGADRALVIKRLIEKGVDPAKLPGG